jgi:integration host factor subunit beta
MISLARERPVVHPDGMTRSQLIDAVAQKLHLEQATAERAVRVVFQAMTEALERGEGIELRGFGSFTVRSYRAYRGRNPRNGRTVEVPAKRSAAFKVGKPFRMRVEGGDRLSHAAAESGLRLAAAAAVAGAGPLAEGDDGE